jgi:hypothetical protein
MEIQTCKIMTIYLVERLTIFGKEISVCANMMDSFWPGGSLSSVISPVATMNFDEP